MTLIILFNLLKIGDINIINEPLIERSLTGYTATSNIITRIKYNNDYGKLGLIFPFFPFTFLFIKKYGIKLFLRNFDFFLVHNFSIIIHLIIYIARKKELHTLEKMAIHLAHIIGM